MIQGGSTANKTGNQLQKFVNNALEENGYTFVEGSRFFAMSKVAEQPIYSRQVKIGKTIYDTDRFCDFILFHPTKFSDCLIIECKWQQSSGSVDEKYPFLVLNIHKLGTPTIILLDGGGYKSGASKWLREQVSGCLLGIYSMAEFQKQLNKGFLG